MNASDTVTESTEGVGTSTSWRSIIMMAAAVTALGGGAFAVWQAGFRPSRGRAPVQPVTVVAEYPHDPTAYTQGLVFHDGGFYESTGNYGESTLRRVELKTGRVLRNQPLDRRYFAEGLVLWDGDLVQITWKARIGFVYDRETFDKAAGPVEPKKRFRYTGQGWGLTHDGRQFVMSDGTSTLRFLDPKTFRVRRRLQVTDGGRRVEDLNELEYIDGEIFANIWYSDLIARIDPKTGRVNSWLDCSRLYPARDRPERDNVLNGIAYDPDTKRLFVTGKHWPKLYEVRIGE